MGDHRGAELEVGTAQSVAKKVDSQRLMQRCGALKERLGGLATPS